MTVEAPAAGETGWLDGALASQAFRRTASAAIAAVLIGFAAARIEPTVASTPLIASPGRTYYLLAAAIILVATLAAGGLRLDRRALFEASPWEAGLLALGASTLLFAAYRSPAVILLVGGLTAMTAYGAQASHQAPPAAAAGVGRYATTLVVLLLFAGGLFAFRMRTLYAAPLAMLAAVLVFRQLRSHGSGRETLMSGSLVVAVIAAEMVWALGFLNISAWLAAAVWTASIIAVLYGFAIVNEDRHA